MNFPLTPEGITLIYSTRVIEEIDRVIDNNLDNLQLLALFISRLLKGLQNLCNDNLEINSSWGEHFFEIEDIAKVYFGIIIDPGSNEKFITVDTIQWTFATSRFFSGFEQ